jgi:predicted permease
MMWACLPFRGRLGFTLAVSVVLAASGGLNLAVFALVNALWLRPTPVQDSGRVVTIVGQTFGNLTGSALSSFERVAGQAASHLGLEPALEFDDVPRPLEVMGVTSGYFRLFGLKVRGRDFTEEDDREGAEPVAIISDRLWQQAFGRRPDVLGAMVGARPVAVRIVGVAPPGFEGAQRGERTDAWIPSAVLPRVLRARPESRFIPLDVWARLRPGDTVAAADRRFKERSPNISVLPLSDVYGTPRSRTTQVSLGGEARVVSALALLVLFGGCAAVASLLLVHYERRRLEFGVRSALGASPARLARQVCVELGILGVTGTVGAMAVAHLALRGLPVLHLNLPADVDLARLDASFDWRVLAAGVGMTAATLALAASLPVVRLMRTRVVVDLLGGPATTASVASQRVRQGLLAVLVGATVVVLISAALFVRTVDRAFARSPGFDADRLLFASVPVTPPVTFKSLDFQWERVRLAWDALRAIPGVEDVAYGHAPISEAMAAQVRTPRTFTTGGEARQLRMGLMLASPDVLPALGVPILVGRDLTAADLNAQPVPTVVTRSAAGRLWPSESPLGQRLGNGAYVIVGVAGDFAYGLLLDPADGVLVTPAEDKGSTARFILRTRRPDAALMGDVRAVLQDVLPDAPTATLVTGRELLSRDLGRQRLGAWFFSAFGLVALMVGIGSVFGMVAYLAESRRREFGIRLALGAAPRNLVAHGALIALLPVGIGLAGGLSLAAIVSRVFSSLLVGVSPLDGLAYVAVSVLLFCAAGGAALTAAWRLRRLGPAEVLRTS